MLAVRIHQSDSVRQAGFSLLELLIAVSIMAMSLAVIYRVMGGSMRTAGVVERQQYAMVLAESLMGSRDFVDPAGWNESGEIDGMSWTVRSAPFVTSVSKEAPNATPLHEVSIAVTWGGGARLRKHLDLARFVQSVKP